MPVSNIRPLVSRVLTFAVIGLVVALIYPALVRACGRNRRSRRLWPGRAAGCRCCRDAGLYVRTDSRWSVPPTEPAVTPVVPGTEQKDWAHWGNTTAGNRFAALDQINKGNIDKLQVAWTFRTGDIPQSTGAGAEDQNTPLQIGDTVYTCTAYGKVSRPGSPTPAPSAGSSTRKAPRPTGSAAAAWATSTQALRLSAEQPTACTKRLFLPTGDARLIAINADTGKPCEEFGNQGTVDLTTDMGGSEARVTTSKPRPRWSQGTW